MYSKYCVIAQKMTILCRLGNKLTKATKNQSSEYQRVLLARDDDREREGAVEPGRVRLGEAAECVRSRTITS